jgi:hypothetical protein
MITSYEFSITYFLFSCFLQLLPALGLELSCNGAGLNPFSMVNPSLKNLFSSSAVHGGVVAPWHALETSAFTPGGVFFYEIMLL